MAQNSKKYFDLNKPVFWPAAFLIVSFIVITLSVGKPMEEVFESLQNRLSDYAGWFFVLVTNIFLIFCVYVGFSKLGRIRLGGKDAKPEFSLGAWFAMLFSAGMGIGIIFWGVAEPMNHFLTPPLSQEDLPARAQQAMGYSFLHWGLHAWGIYALVGLALAFFAFSRKLPLTIRSVFYPVMGDRIYGWIGHVIDILAVLATLFGLATSLGLGVQQVNSGLNYLIDVPDSVTTQVLLIAGITAVATISVVLGVHGGVKKLSELNLRLGAVFLVFMLIIGPTLFIFDSFIQNIGYYLQNFFDISYWTEAYQSGDGGNWQNDWTLFYWSWWISWSPFVGMFIARVSRGRTVRQFIMGTLLVPSLVTFLWMTAFGGSALWIETTGVASIGQDIIDNVSTSLFVLLDQFPLAMVSSAVGVVLVINFFVTSSDSGSLVVDSITAGGKLDAPVGQRIFWAVTEGAVAAVLLIGGGLNALQTATITTGLPFAFVLLLMMYSLYKGLNKDYSETVKHERKQERDALHKAIKEKEKAE